MSQRVENDRGAVAVMFALLVTGLLGIGVLVVDVGALYVEGRQLQNGAENAALAVAKTCATTGCAPAAGNDLANANAMDGFSQVELVCGTAGLPAGACPTSGERDRFGCGPVTGTVPYVQVQTRSLRSDGSNVVPGFLARVLNPSYPGAGVRACARAAYGSPGGLTGELPLAISECEFKYWRDLYGLVNPAYPAAAEATLYFHAKGDKGLSNCPARNPANNMDAPGGFGWLTTSAGSCETATTVSGDGQADLGNDVPKDCPALAFAAMWKQVVGIPVYSTIYKDPVTGKVMYNIVDYAAFYLSGYKLGNGNFQRASATLGGLPCDNPDRCISGFFTKQAVTTSGPLMPGPGYGTTAIKVTG